MPRFHARFILTMTGPPLIDGWIDVEGGRIVAVGPAPAPVGRTPADVRDLGQVSILPGLVNAHTHLELSGHRGQVPPSQSMPDWVRRLMAARDASGVVRGDVSAAIGEARACGTSLVGDVTNTLATIDPLRESPLHGVVFNEVIGFRPADPTSLACGAADAAEAAGDEGGVRVRLAAHAPYSVSPRLFAALGAEISGRVGTPFGVHLGESPEETAFLQSGTGKWRELLEDLGVWDPEWRPPECGPVEYLTGLGWLHQGLLAAHCVHLTDAELACLARAEATVVTCPRSNEWTGAGSPPVARFYASGVRVAVGTDSLASCPDLNVFAELAALRRLAPDVPARRLLESATCAGAHALGFSDDFGVIAPGRRSELIAVSIPAGVQDVEEYLVGGIEPRQISWVSA